MKKSILNNKIILFVIIGEIHGRSQKYSQDQTSVSPIEYRAFQDFQPWQTAF